MRRILMCGSSPSDSSSLRLVVDYSMSKNLAKDALNSNHTCPWISGGFDWEDCAEFEAFHGGSWPLEITSFLEAAKMD